MFKTGQHLSSSRFFCLDQKASHQLSPNAESRCVEDREAMTWENETEMTAAQAASQAKGKEQQKENS